MKKLHQFIINKNEEVDEVTVTQDEAGKEVKTTKKVTKPVPYKFSIAKPTRSQMDDADLYYAVKLSEGIKAGLLTKTLLAKRIDNDGGSLSEPEKMSYANSYLLLIDKQAERQSFISSLGGKEPNEEQKTKLEALEKEIKDTYTDIQKFEFSQITMFDQTAESRARNKTIVWWLMNLSLEEKDGKEEPLFGKGDLDDKLDKHQELIELEDKFINEAINRLIYYVSFWFMGRTTKPEDFVALDKQNEEDRLKREAEELAKQVVKDTIKGNIEVAA